MRYHERNRKMNLNDQNLENPNMGSALAINALDSIPQPNPDARRIVALVKKSGRITGYQLSDGNVITREQGVDMAKNGGIAGVGIAHRGETEYLKSIPDGTDDNNLSSLPTV